MKKTHSIFRLIVIVLLVLPIALFLILQSSPGKTWLAASLSTALSGSGNGEVRVGQIRGIIPAQIDLESLEISDAEGVWLSARKLRFRWAMKDLFKGVVHVTHLGAESIEIDRVPQMPPASQPKEKKQFRAMELVLDGLKVESLSLGEAIAGVPLRYSVGSGGIQLHADGRLSGAVTVAGDATGQLEIAAPPSGSEAYAMHVVAELSEWRKPAIGLEGLHAVLKASVSAGSSEVELSAGADGIELGLDAQVAVADGSWNVAVRMLKVEYLNTFGFSLQGSVGSERVDLQGALAEFNVGQLPLDGASNFSGRLSGRISLTGPLAEPEMSAVVDVFDLSTSQIALDELPDLDFHINAALKSGLLSAVSSTSNSVLGSMQAQAQMPCILSLNPWRFDPQPAHLTGSFQAAADLEVLNGLSILNNERIAGRCLSELTYDGQAEQKLQGHITLSDGAYEHYDWGVVIHRIQADLAADPKGLIIRNMQASDGNKGRIKVAGGIGIWQPGMPLDLTVDIKKANLIRRDEVEATLSGALQVGGVLSRPELKGKLVVDRADILLNNMARPEPRLLTSFDLNAPVAQTARAQKELPFSMNIAVSMPDQIYMNSPLMNSVWGGELRLKNAPGGISVAGVIQPRRGNISFVGKKFQLLNDGRIDLDGAIPPEPALTITAEYSRSDIVAELALSGKLSNPTYSLSSTPALPEDEILSYILFGRETSSISPYQAFQIAAAARQLSGGASGGGLLYQVRRVLSIDTLEWREPDTLDGSSSVAAGKYITPELYIEVNSTLDGPDADRAGFLAEYELTRHFSVETSSGPQMRAGIGFNWKYDY
jgi:autotransporter translocation and assembly factor TamB